MNTITKTLFTLLTATFATACGQMSSSEVATHDIEASIVLTADGAGDTQVDVELRHARSAWSEFINLDAGDELVAQYDGRTRRLNEGEVISYVGYGGRLATDLGGTPVRIALDRPLFESAPNSRVSLPDRYRAYATRGVYDVDFDTIPIEWSNGSRDDMTVKIDGECIWDFEQTLAFDDGVFLLRPGMLDVRSSWMGEPCTLRVTLERSRFGRLDPALSSSGHIVARQVRYTSAVIEAW